MLYSDDCDITKGDEAPTYGNEGTEMAGAQDPAVQRRRLRAELKKARQATGRTQRDVAHALDWSPSKLIRIETGAVGITPTDLRALLSHYEVKDKRRIDELVDLARGSKKQKWSEYRDVLSSDYLIYLSYEASASISRQFQPMLIPGLLQTEEYARAVLADAYQYQPQQVDRRWEARQERQELMTREEPKPPEMFFVLDEAVIRREVGGRAVMRNQLIRLLELAALPHVNVQILPFSIGTHPGMKGPFIILEFAGPEDDVLYLENTSGEVTTREDPEGTVPYVNAFWRLEEIALSPDASLRYLEAVIDQMSSATTFATQATVTVGDQQAV